MGLHHPPQPKQWTVSPFVLQQTGNASEDATFVFDKQLDNGMYMLNITAADGQTFTRRVVIAN
jgi:hypothetical protein